MIVKREQYWLDKLSPFVEEGGYNILRVANSSSGYKHDDKARKKISQAARRWYDNGGVNPMKGIKMSKESRLKMSLARKGKRTGRDNPFYGKTHSDETKRMLSEIRKQSKIRGERHPSSKLSEAQVKKVKVLLRDTDYKPREIAKIVGIDVNYVYDIKRQKTWNHVDISDINSYDEIE